MPQSLASGPPRLLQYSVHLLNGDGKGAGPALVEVLAGSTPASLQNVDAVPVEDGVLLRWQAGSSTEESRILLRVKRGTMPGEAPPWGGGKKTGESLLAVASKMGDPAGTLDTGARPGVAQHYSIVREQTVHLHGKDFSMTSAPVLVSVAADAKLPPTMPPAGLQAIVNTLGAPEIDLVWQPSTPATGYFVFRAEGSSQPVLLTAEPVHGLSYRDTAVRPGARYRYSVSATGRDGTQGPRSSEIEEQVPDR